jgi:hypothetical protein
VFGQTLALRRASGSPDSAGRVGQRPYLLSDSRRSRDRLVSARRGGAASLAGDPARLSATTPHCHLPTGKSAPSHRRRSSSRAPRARDRAARPARGAAAPRRQRVNTMSSATPTRPGPARRCWPRRSPSAPASRDGAFASPRSPAWPTSSKKPRAAASSPASSAATRAPSSSSWIYADIRIDRRAGLPRTARRRRRTGLPNPLRTPRTRQPDRHHKPAPRGVNQGLPDPRLAKAVVDRLTRPAHTIDTRAESWRFRHGLTRTSKPGRPATR